MERHRLRGFRTADTAAVVDLALRAWEPVFASFEDVLGRRLYRRLYPDWRAQQARSVREALGDNESWVSVSGSRVTGFVNVIFDTSEASGEIFMIAVHPDHQRLGIGTELTRLALSEMRRRGLTLATVATGGDPGHGPARRTYERSGFTPFPQILYARLLDPEDPEEPG